MKILGFDFVATDIYKTMGHIPPLSSFRVQHKL